jgi:triacylglycerol lipase
MLDALAPARRRLVQGIIALAALLLVAAGIIGIAHRSPGVTPVAQDAQPPIVLVPGYGGSTTDLDVLAAALRSAGRTARVVDLGRESRSDLHGQANLLDDTVQAVLRETDADSVDLVGYSAGGVTVRVWLADHSGGDIARRVVTLGSPHHGTELAGLAVDIAPDACPEACRQLAPDSSLLRALNAGDETPEGPAWVSIWTEQDKTVVPPSSSALDGAVAFSVQSVCPREQVSHGGLPASPVVAAMVIRELGLTAPGRPGKDVCLSR